MSWTFKLKVYSVHTHTWILGPWTDGAKTVKVDIAKISHMYDQTNINWQIYTKSEIVYTLVTAQVGLVQTALKWSKASKGKANYSKLFAWQIRILLSHSHNFFYNTDQTLLLTVQT